VWGTVRARMLDVFISYRHADAEHVHKLVAACKRAGLQVWFDEKRVETFGSIQAAIETGLAEAKALLVWYSPAYPQSRACQWELSAAFVAAQRDGDVRRRILIVNPANDNKHIQPVELRDARYAVAPGDLAAFDVLASAIKQQCGLLETPLGATSIRVRPIWYGSASGIGSSRFIGRMREMWEIHSGLLAATSPIITDRVAQPLVWLTGMGGSGKSVLAEEYALRFSAAYPGGIVWLRAFGHDDVRANASAEWRTQDREAQVAALAESTGIDVKGLAASDIRIKLGAKLDSMGKYLWVVDDLPSDSSWDATLPWLAPSALGHTLVSTRRRHESGQGVQVRVEELDEDDAYTLLTTQRVPESPEQQSLGRQIVRGLGLNPLGIELAAAAIAQVGYTEFAEQLEHPADDELEFAASLLSAAGESLPHREGSNMYLSRTLLTSTRGLSEQGFDVLRLAAQVAVAPISRDVIAHTLAATDGAAEVQARRRADLAIVELISRSLGRPAAAGGIQVHALVSRVVRFHHNAPERTRVLRGGALEAFVQQFAALRDGRTHPELANDALHARRLVDSCRASAEAEQVPKQILLLGALGRFEAGLGRYSDALPLYKEGVALSQRVHGESHPTSLAMVASYGSLLASSGKVVEGRALLEVALQGAVKTYGEDSIITHGVKTNLASVLLAMSAHEAAIDMLRETAESMLRTPGADLAGLLLTFNNAATAQLSAGNAREAEQLIRAVVSARSQVLGVDHPHTLMSRNTLAGTLHEQGHTPEAIEILQNLIADLTRVLGEAHPETLTVRGNLASLLKQSGDIDGAVQTQRNLLELYAASFGSEFPETIRARINLAESLSSTGQWFDAEALLRNAVAQTQTLGQTHELTLLAEGNYGMVLQEQGRVAEARQLQQAVLDKRLSLNGEMHPATIIGAENLAVTMQRQEDWAGARDLFSGVVSARVQMYGDSHFETLNPMTRLARVCLAQKDYATARKLFEHIVNARVITLGEAHAETRAAMYNLGETLRNLGESTAAAGMLERVYHADSAALGADHDDTLRSLELWAMIVFEAKDYAQSWTLWGQLAALRERRFGVSHFDTLSALDTQASSYEGAGDSASARRLRERLVQVTREAYGVAHPATAVSLKNLVLLLQRSGDHVTAAELSGEFLEAARAAGVSLPAS
jgi:tetratricopeptide (TPR) repeat protein